MIFLVNESIEEIVSNGELSLEEKQRQIRSVLEDCIGAVGLDDMGRVKRNYKLEYLREAGEEAFQARQIAADADTLLINHMERLGWHPLMVACKYDEPELVRWLITQEGAAVDLANDNGITALHVAAENNRLDVARVLLELGADINYKKSSFFDGICIGTTALDKAIHSGHLNFVKFLVEAGITISTKDHEHYTQLIESLRKRALASYSESSRNEMHHAARKTPSVEEMEAIAQYFAKVAPNVDSSEAAKINRHGLFSGNEPSATDNAGKEVQDTLRSLP